MGEGKEISAGLVKELRDKTGAGFMDCKAALTESKGDMETAIVWLRTKGLAAAAKRAGRATSDGKIESYIHAGSKLGVMVEIRCETDFVSRTPEFGQFTRDVAMHIAASNPLYLKRADVPQDMIQKEREIYTAQEAREDNRKDCGW
jgi:elongation factor Ts